MKKISFDFDDTLSYKDVQDYAQDLISNDIDVHIVTSRYEDVTRYNFGFGIVPSHDDMFEVAERLNIPKDKIHFTDFKNKYHFFKDNEGYILHIDNDLDECALINANSNTIAIHLDYQYKENCNKILGIGDMNGINLF